jgi:hypothetical protein
MPTVTETRPSAPCTLDYLPDGRVVVTQRPSRCSVPLSVVSSLASRFSPIPGVLRFDCGTTYRLGDHIDWSVAQGKIELILLTESEMAPDRVAAP